MEFTLIAGIRFILVRCHVLSSVPSLNLCRKLQFHLHAPSFSSLTRRRECFVEFTACTSLLSLRLQSHSRVRFFGGLGGGSDLHRDFHSTPDLNVQAQSSSALVPKSHRSQEDVNALNGRNGLPPPNHPPPPPPVGQVVKVNVGANVPDVVTPASVYDNMAHIQQVKGNSHSFITHPPRINITSYHFDQNKSILI